MTGSISPKQVKAYTDLVNSFRGRVDFDPKRTCETMIKKLERYLADPKKGERHEDYKKNLAYYQDALACIEAGQTG